MPVGVDVYAVTTDVGLMSIGAETSPVAEATLPSLPNMAKFMTEPATCPAMRGCNNSLGWPTTCPTKTAVPYILPTGAVTNWATPAGASRTLDVVDTAKERAQLTAVLFWNGVLAVEGMTLPIREGVPPVHHELKLAAAVAIGCQNARGDP